MSQLSTNIDSSQMQSPSKRALSGGEEEYEEQEVVCQDMLLPDMAQQARLLDDGFV